VSGPRPRRPEFRSWRKPPILGLTVFCPYCLLPGGLPPALDDVARQRAWPLPPLSVASHIAA